MMKTLKAKLQGTWNYYGLIGNYRRMKLFYDDDLPGAAQVAQPAESTPKHDVASAQSPAGTFPSAATAHCGKEWSEDALPAGTEFLSAAAGRSQLRGTSLAYARAS